MNLLLPLGLLGLLSIVVLLVIYLIKPNYQQKFVSSTYVWNLSLRYQKRRIPVSKLRNILLIICQVLILAACAFILAKPAVKTKDAGNYNEKILIIEASANMMAMDAELNSETYGETRFERAVRAAETNAKALIMEKKGAVSIILAGREATLLIHRADSSRMDEVNALFEALVPKDMYGFVISDEIKCGYGRANIEGAMTLAGEILEENPQSEVVFYTATDYFETGAVTVVNVAEESEWNVAILGGKAALNENYYYTFSVELAVYGRTASVELCLEVMDVNGKGESVTFYGDDGLLIQCDEQKKVYSVTLNTADFATGDEYAPSPDDPNAVENRAIQSYSYARVYVNRINGGRQGVVDDSLTIDNSYYFYGGTKPKLKIQYYSPTPSTLTNAVIATWVSTLSSVWDIVPTEVSIKDFPQSTGFDLYIYEHTMPSVMPMDGVVMLLGPYSEAPGDSGLTFEGELSASDFGEDALRLKAGAQHSITANITAESIEVTSYMKIRNDSGDYEELMYCGDDPVILVKNTPAEKVFVMGVDIHRSNITMLPRYSLMMLDAFKYFFPAPISGNAYEVGDTVQLNAMSGRLSLMRGGKTTVYTNDPGYAPSGIDVVYTEMPATVVLEEAGRYAIEQSFLSGTPLTTNFFVKIPSSESDTVRSEAALVNPPASQRTQKNNYELFIFLAAALIALLLVEWWLQSRSQY